MSSKSNQGRFFAVRFGFEGVLIVASILAALAIDSWWSARQHAAEEQDLLVQLRAEFEANAALLAVRRESHEEVLLSTSRLLVKTAPEFSPTEFDFQDLQRDVGHMLMWWTFDPQSGVLTSIIQSGKLGIIRSDELRNALSAWPSRVQDLVEDEGFLVNFAQQLMMPYLVENTSTRQLDFAGNKISSAGTFPADFEKLLSDRTFESLVTQKYHLTLGALDEYDQIKPRIDEILQLIDAQIEN